MTFVFKLDIDMEKIYMPKIGSGYNIQNVLPVQAHRQTNRTKDLTFPLYKIGSTYLPRYIKYLQKQNKINRVATAFIRCLVINPHCYFSGLFMFLLLIDGTPAISYNRILRCLRFGVCSIPSCYLLVLLPGVQDISLDTITKISL